MNHKLPLTSTALICIIAGGLLGPVQAASASQPETGGTATTVTSRELASLESGVDTANHLFDAELARQSGASASDIQEYASGYLAGGGRAENVTVNAATIDMLRGATSIEACKGKNRYDVTGLQQNIYFDSCVSQDIIGKIAVGAGAAAIAGLITAETGIGGLAGGLVAGILTIGGGALGSCAARGSGVVIHQLLPTAIIWCNAQ
jgi:hypothetical protein